MGRILLLVVHSLFDSLSSYPYLLLSPLVPPGSTRLLPSLYYFLFFFKEEILLLTLKEITQGNSMEFNSPHTAGSVLEELIPQGYL
jgi:hypothetical protein